MSHEHWKKSIKVQEPDHKISPKMSSSDTERPTITKLKLTTVIARQNLTKTASNKQNR